MGDNCIFCKISRGEIPAKKVYEDDDFVAFHDINPAAPVHLLLIPRRHIASLQDVTREDAGWLGRMVALARAWRWKTAAARGTRRLPSRANSGAEGGQEVPHLHFHIIGGSRPWKGRVAPNA